MQRQVLGGRGSVCAGQGTGRAGQRHGRGPRFQEQQGEQRVCGQVAEGEVVGWQRQIRRGLTGQGGAPAEQSGAKASELPLYIYLVERTHTPYN